MAGSPKCPLSVQPNGVHRRTLGLSVSVLVEILQEVGEPQRQQSGRLDRFCAKSPLPNLVESHIRMLANHLHDRALPYRRMHSLLGSSRMFFDKEPPICQVARKGPERLEEKCCAHARLSHLSEGPMVQAKELHSSTKWPGPFVLRVSFRGWRPSCGRERLARVP